MVFWIGFFGQNGCFGVFEKNTENPKSVVGLCLRDLADIVKQQLKNNK